MHITLNFSLTSEDRVLRHILGTLKCPEMMSLNFTLTAPMTPEYLETIKKHACKHIDPNPQDPNPSNSNVKQFEV
jgi:hypothetical protein